MLGCFNPCLGQIWTNRTFGFKKWSSYCPVRYYKYLLVHVEQTGAAKMFYIHNFKSIAVFLFHSVVVASVCPVKHIMVCVAVILTVTVQKTLLCHHRKNISKLRAKGDAV